ncbi:hypothetical protein RZS08_03975, partial [Arthrospira platensis SPKY1]|nr:hypothetical protein [Arthrospira platensis SPKY1]
MRVRSTRVEAIPPAVSPPSSSRSRPGPNEVNAASPVKVDAAPAGFADVAVNGPTRASSERSSAWDGIRTATEGPAAA